MSRIIAIDYGTKRCGIAVTDPLQIIATGLATVSTSDLLEYLLAYLAEHKVEALVFGMPRHKDGTPTKVHSHIVGFVRKLSEVHPSIAINYQDESFSSAEAADVIRMSGVRRKKRQDRSLVDKVSAVIILQRYLGHI